MTQTDSLPRKHECKLNPSRWARPFPSFFFESIPPSGLTLGGGGEGLALLLRRRGLRAGGVTSEAARPWEGSAPTALSDSALRSLKKVEEILLKRGENWWLNSHGGDEVVVCLCVCWHVNCMLNVFAVERVEANASYLRAPTRATPRMNLDLFSRQRLINGKYEFHYGSKYQQTVARASRSHNESGHGKKRKKESLCILLWISRQQQFLA